MMQSLMCHRTHGPYFILKPCYACNSVCSCSAGLFCLLIVHTCCRFAEIVMASSAVLAVVVMGLYVNYHKSTISGVELTFLHEVCCECTS
jgi:hypothetical protein